MRTIAILLGLMITQAEGAMITHAQAQAIKDAANEMVRPVIYHDDLATARVVAARTGKPLMAIVTSPSCSHCRVYEAWSGDVQVKVALSNYTVYRENVTVRNSFGVRRVPTHVIGGRHYVGIGNLQNPSDYARVLYYWSVPVNRRMK